MPSKRPLTGREAQKNHDDEAGRHEQHSVDEVRQRRRDELVKHFRVRSHTIHDLAGQRFVEEGNRLIQQDSEEKKANTFEEPFAGDSGAAHPHHGDQGQTTSKSHHFINISVHITPHCRIFSHAQLVRRSKNVAEEERDG